MQPPSSLGRWVDQRRLEEWDMFGDGLKVAPSGQQAGVPGTRAFSKELNSLSSHWAVQYGQGFLWTQKRPLVAVGKVQTTLNITTYLLKRRKRGIKCKWIRKSISSIQRPWLVTAEKEMICKDHSINSNKALTPTDGLCKCWPRASPSSFPAHLSPLFLHTGTPHTCLSQLGNYA